MSDARLSNDAATRPRWTWMAALGMVMVAAAPLLMLIAGLVFGLELGDEGPLLVSLIVVPTVVAFLIWRFGTWARVVGIVVALAAIGAMFWTAFGLAEPTSFFDFMPGLLVVPGALISIVGCVASIVAARRGHVSAAREGGERRATNVVVAVVGVLAALSAVLTLTSRTSVAEGDADLWVHQSDFAFEQDAYQAAAGSTVAVRNDDPFHHTFTIDALDIDLTLGPRSAATVELPAQAGTYVVYCRPHTMNPESPGEDDMWTRLTIT